MKPKPTRLLQFTPVRVFAAVSMAIVGTVHAQTWNGGGTDDLWGTGENWGGTAPVPGITTDITFAGSTRLTPQNNYTAFDDFRSIYFAAGASSFTINGNAIDLFGKIENNSSNTQTVNLSIGTGSASGSFIEMNPVSGNLNIGGSDVFLGNNQLRVWGNNGKTLTFGAGTVISGTGGSFALNQNSIVVFQSAHTYTGDTFINAGRLEMASGSSIANSQIQLGDTTGTAAAELRLTQNGGYNFNRNITVRSGSTGVKTINSTNTSGTNTISGTITFNAPNTNVKASSGGTLAITSAIAGTSGGGIIIGGGGTVNLTGGGSIGGGTGSYFSVDSGTLNVRTTPLTTSAGYRMSIGWNTATPGVLNVDGTSLTLTANTEVDVGAGYNGVQTTGTGIINIGGTSSSPGLLDLGTTTGAFKLGAYTGGTGSGTLNLNAYGTLATNRGLTLNTIANSGMVNFDGGTFKLTGNQTAMLGSTLVVTVKSGGAIVDTAGFNGTIPAALLAGTGSGGLTKNGTGTLTLGAANTFTGDTRITAGTLTLGNSGSLQNSTVDLNGGDSGSLSFGTLTAASFGGLKGSRNLTLANATPAAVALTVGSNNASTAYSGVLSGGGSLAKSGTGTLELTNGNTFSGGTSLGGGTLKLSGGDNRLASSGTVSFTAASTLDVTNTSQTLNGLVLLGAGQTNTISGSAGTLILQGSGDYTVNTTATGTSLNMSGLSNFTFNRTSNSFQLSSNGTNVVNTVNLAKTGTNTINAANVRFGGGANTTGQNVLIGLGQDNRINASGEFVIGYFQGNGNVSFQSGLTAPSLTVRGAGGGNNAIALMTVGSTNSGNQPSTGILNLAGGSLDVIATELNIARHFANAGGTNSTGTITMPGGSVVATTMNIASKANATTGAPTLTGTFNQSGGMVTATTLNLGNNTNAEAPNLIANYNLSGGTLYAASITGSGATYGASTVRNLKLDGGTLRNIAGSDLTVNGVANTTTGRININVTSSSIIHADVGRTITLEANTALAGSGNLAKNGDGTLFINGATSTYSGAVTVNAGTLLVTGQLGASSVTINDNATLAGSGTIGGSVVFSADAKLDFGSSLVVNSGTVTFGSGFDMANILGLDNTVEDGTYTLISGLADVDLTGVLNVGAGNAYDLGGGKSAYFQKGSLQVVVIPEPRAALLGGIGALLLLRRRRS